MNKRIRNKRKKELEKVRRQEIERFLSYVEYGIKNTNHGESRLEPVSYIFMIGICKATTYAEIIRCVNEGINEIDYIINK